MAVVSFFLLKNVSAPKAMVVPGGNLIGSSIFLSLSYATFLSIFLWERKERARKKRKEKRADGRFAPARRPLAGQYEKQSHVGSEFFYVTRRYFSSGISFGKVAVTKRISF